MYNILKAWVFLISVMYLLLSIFTMEKHIKCKVYHFWHLKDTIQFIPNDLQPSPLSSFRIFSLSQKKTLCPFYSLFLGMLW
jgi:hypothetical protein